MSNLTLNYNITLLHRNRKLKILEGYVAFFQCKTEIQSKNRRYSDVKTIKITGASACFYNKCLGVIGQIIFGTTYISHVTWLRHISDVMRIFILLVTF